MFVAEAVTTLTKALQDTFGSVDYPVAQFKSLHVSHEYPMKQQDYPGVWVDLTVAQMRTAGIGHYEVIVDEQEVQRAVQRWRFTGIAEYTIAALTSLERARLFDEVVKVMVFGDFDSVRRTFRESVEDSGLIRMSMDFDDLNVGGWSATPGTPWGTQQIIYEVTITQDVQGEFLSDPSTDELLPLSAIEIIDWVEGLEQDPTLPEEGGDGWQ